MAKNNDAVWNELDPASLPAPARDAYDRYKALYKQAKTERLVFEEAMNTIAELPEGVRMVFGYNFGKLSAAIVADDRKPAKATPAKQSLSDFLASQQAAGKRA